MIAPVVLINAAGSLIMSTSSRLGRASDRIRRLSERAIELGNDDTGTRSPQKIAEERAMLAPLAPWLIRRVRLLHLALLGCYLSVALCVLSPISIGAGSFEFWTPHQWPVGLLFAGAISMGISGMMLTVEAYFSWRTNMAELHWAADQMAEPQAHAPVK